MESLLLYGFLAVVAVAVLYGLAVMLLPGSEQMSPPAADVAPWTLPDAPLQARDVIEMRLPVGVRGYRFAETDLLLDRLTEELRVRELELADLRNRAAALAELVDYGHESGSLPAAAGLTDHTEHPEVAPADAAPTDAERLEAQSQDSRPYGQ